MRFIKLHQGGREFLVNLSNVSEVYTLIDDNKSRLFFNFSRGDQSVRITVDESLDETYKSGQKRAVSTRTAQHWRKH